MERVVIIEVCDQQGKIVERFRTSKFPARIGRAYDNDLIIDDPFVCPHHCELTISETGAVIINDLASVNGTFILGDVIRSEQVNVGHNSQLRIGHTLLHFRMPYEEVEATRIDSAMARHGHKWPPKSLSINISVLLLGAMVMTLTEYLGSYTEFEYGRHFFNQQIPTLIAVAGWAAIWSIVSRVTAHHFVFLRHATILVSIILAIYLSDYLLDFMKFGFAIQWPFEMVSVGISVVAITLLLFWHLRLCSDLKRSRLFAVASIISVVFMGLVQINDYLDSREFRSIPLYPTTIKPPAFQLVKSKPVDKFLVESEQLRKEINREIESQKTVVPPQAVIASRPEK